MKGRMESTRKDELTWAGGWKIFSTNLLTGEQYCPEDSPESQSLPFSFTFVGGAAFSSAIKNPAHFGEFFVHLLFSIHPK